MRNILVVVDMQKDFVDGALETKEAVEIVPKVVREIKKKYDDVYVTMDTHAENYLETQEGKYLPVVHCVKDTDGWKLDKKVEKALGKLDHYRVVEKPTFGSEELVRILKEEDGKEEIGSITLIGLCTDICVVSNALLLKAAFYEKDIAVKKDCCAGVTVHSHDAALETMRMCQIRVI